VEPISIKEERIPSLWQSFAFVASASFPVVAAQYNFVQENVSLYWLYVHQDFTFPEYFLAKMYLLALPGVVPCPQTHSLATPRSPKKAKK
jgi:hypothetical protein